MKRPVFHRTAGFSLWGYRSPFGSKPSGLYVDFQPANSEAWILLGVFVLLAIFCGFGLPLLIGEEIQFGTNTLPTGICSAIAVVLAALCVCFVFSEPAEQNDGSGSKGGKS